MDGLSWLPKGWKVTGGPYTHSFDPGATREPTEEELEAFDDMWKDLQAQAEEHNPIDE